jgi:hypothetical protein
MARAVAIDPPKKPFHPIDSELPKALALERANALHRLLPRRDKEGVLIASRRELVGWPGLTEETETADGEESLPEFFRMGTREVRDLDHSIVALAIREEAVMTDYRLPTLVVGFALWSDGCEPNATLLNRGSVWALLLTLCCQVAHVNPFSYTYLVSTGADVSTSLSTRLLQINLFLTTFLSHRVRTTTKCSAKQTRS